jgi:hypothetical protein
MTTASGTNNNDRLKPYSINSSIQEQRKLDSELSELIANHPRNKKLRYAPLFSMKFSQNQWTTRSRDSLTKAIKTRDGGWKSGTRCSNLMASLLQGSFSVDSFCSCLHRFCRAHLTPLLPSGTSEDALVDTGPVSAGRQHHRFGSGYRQFYDAP